MNINKCYMCNTVYQSFNSFLGKNSVQMTACLECRESMRTIPPTIKEFYSIVLKAWNNLPPVFYIEGYKHTKILFYDLKERIKQDLGLTFP